MLCGNESLTAHSCLSAHVAAADHLGEPGKNLYHPQNYPRKGDDAKRRSAVGAGLRPHCSPPCAGHRLFTS
jgi:hypothetical protein